MKELDRIAIEEYGIPGVVLMENAGMRAADSALRMLYGTSAHSLDKKKVVVFCGKGNNGGDGFVVARHLINKGVGCNVYLTAAKADVRSDARVNLNILLKMGRPVEEITGIDSGPEEVKSKISRICSEADLIIDALLGTGISGRVTGPYETAIDLINNSRSPVLAIDTPSGLDVDSGNILGVCVRASRTVTFGLAKKGFYLNTGPEYTGELIIADISLPRDIIKG